MNANDLKPGDVGTCTRRGVASDRTYTYSVSKSARGTIRVLVEADEFEETLNADAFLAAYEPGLTLDALLELVRSIPPPTPEERRQQAISFAYGNVKLSNPNVTREMCEAAWDRLHPNGYAEAPTAVAAAASPPVPVVTGIAPNAIATVAHVDNPPPGSTTLAAPPPAAPIDDTVIARTGMANIGKQVDLKQRASGNAGNS